MVLVVVEDIKVFWFCISRCGIGASGSWITGNEPFIYLYQERHSCLRLCVIGAFVRRQRGRSAAAQLRRELLTNLVFSNDDEASMRNRLELNALASTSSYLTTESAD
jgi:hypothetical protein